MRFEKGKEAEDVQASKAVFDRNPTFSSSLLLRHLYHLITRPHSPSPLPVSLAGAPGVFATAVNTSPPGAAPPPPSHDRTHRKCYDKRHHTHF